ncbi:hypothetical protein QUB80_25615 [Chlorogloeopsis sp. ULAP01]|uniref:hypothetical protein n=1 Tax=Chlorogloeopsis sp. ULAP01 TaxID=3056483 RepID=UPI0025AAA100|nr:hypothetical protein [Chlorogloeopsis sp. ULAP01]MDM9384059.1 hypothetical protein [Chlorogloeopsis sp. ULAP01]
MFHGKIEKELLDGEPWLPVQQSKLPLHLQLLVEKKQGRKDVWELPNLESEDAANKKFTSSELIQKHPKFSFFRFFRRLFFN